MKTSQLALCFGLAASLAGTSAFANNGTVNFEGSITASTCPIEVVNPGDSSVGMPVKMGSVPATRFTTIGHEEQGTQFGLRISGAPGCGITPTSKAKVTFNGFPDPTDADYFEVTPGAQGAKGVAIAIKDISGTAIAPGGTSVEYPVNETGPTDLLFNALYRSTLAKVTQGTASAAVQFSVDIY